MRLQLRMPKWMKRQSKWQRIVATLHTIMFIPFYLYSFIHYLSSQINSVRFNCWIRSVIKSNTPTVEASFGKKIFSITFHSLTHQYIITLFVHSLLSGIWNHIPSKFLFLYKIKWLLIMNNYCDYKLLN